MLTRILLIGVLLVSGLSRSALGYNPQGLRQVLNRVDETLRERKTPVVLFDLDDTVIDTRDRTARILREFARQPHIRRQYPNEAARMAQAKPSRMRYGLAGSLEALGVTDPQLISQVRNFWGRRFFTNTYTALDVPLPGAPAYVDSLLRRGATIVYLTGRTQSLMERGTVSSLLRHGFPLGGRAKLIMQPDQETPDVEFKRQAFEGIRKLGVVVAAFENEPANLNAMGAAFPSATLVFLDTVESGKGGRPSSKAHWIRDFTGR